MSHTRLAALAAAALLLPLTANAQATAPAPAAPAAPAAAAPAAPVPGPGAAGFKPLPTTGTANIVETLKASGQFTTLVAAAEKVNLAGLLSTQNPLTLVAPTDAAFAQMDPATLAAAQADPAKLQGLLVYHLVALKVAKSQIAGHKGPIPSAANKPIEADGSAEPLKLNDAVVIQAEVPASNGVIYVVDKVLTPPA